MLIKFADSQAATLDALRAAVDARDFDAVARHAHSIAGASGNLGADDIRASAKALERAGRERAESLPRLLADLEAAAAVAFHSIARLREPRTPPPAKPERLLPPAKVRAALARLKTALDDFDLSAASSAVAELDGVATPETADVLARLRNHVDRYEYDDAGVLAARLLEQMSGEVQ
jgi:HPt (histidine-containing phosphotransfer) domain-containing protein